MFHPDDMDASVEEEVSGFSSLVKIPKGGRVGISFAGFC